MGFSEQEIAEMDKAAAERRKQELIKYLKQYIAKHIQFDRDFFTLINLICAYHQGRNDGPPNKAYIVREPRQ